MPRRMGVLIAVLFFLLYLLPLHNDVCWDHDGYRYLVAGQNLIAGHGYTYQFDFLSLYPPVFSILAGALFTVFGNHGFLALRLHQMVWVLIGLIASYHLIRARFTDSRRRTLWLVVMAVQWNWLFLASVIRSEPPFFGLFALGLLAFQAALPPPGEATTTPAPQRAALLAAASLCFVLATFTRLIGAVSAIAVGLWYLARWRREARPAPAYLIPIFLVGLAMVCWTLTARGRSSHSEAPVSYAKHWGDGGKLYPILRSSQEAVLRASGLLSETAFRALHVYVGDDPWVGPLTTLVGLFFTLPLLLGLYRSPTPLDDFPRLVILAHFAILVIFPYDSFRFWAPVFPLMFLYMLESSGWIATTAFTIAILGGNLVFDVRAIHLARQHRWPAERSQIQEYLEGAARLDCDAPDGEPLATDQSPPMLHYLTGRRILWIQPWDRPAKLRYAGHALIKRDQHPELETLMLSAGFERTARGPTIDLYARVGPAPGRTGKHPRLRRPRGSAPRAGAPPHHPAPPPTASSPASSRSTSP